MSEQQQQKRAEEFLDSYLKIWGGPLTDYDGTVLMLVAHEKAVRKMIVERLVSYEKMIED